MGDNRDERVITRRCADEMSQAICAESVRGNGITSIPHKQYPTSRTFLVERNCGGCKNWLAHGLHLLKTRCGQPSKVFRVINIEPFRAECMRQAATLHSPDGISQRIDW